MKNAAGYHSGPATPSTADGVPSTVLWIRNPFLPKWTKVDGRSIFQDSDDHQWSRSRPDDSQKKSCSKSFSSFFLLLSCLVLVGGLKKSLWCSTSWTKLTRLWFLLLFFDWFVPIYFLSLLCRPFSGISFRCAASPLRIFNCTPAAYNCDELCDDSSFVISFLFSLLFFVVVSWRCQSKKKKRWLIGILPSR